MKILNVWFTEQQYEMLRKLAFENKTHMSKIVRDLVEVKYISCPTNRLAKDVQTADNTANKS